ncbi:hypothetical protein LS482_16570 [Sinomicrobium kalidii]|uniref:hypothetical protein n=1 Tax=Sinomicrobium kalidii TaxID=2900738 RepID=UPI001E28B08D|nr:hypothetical protein [Sinomicrobium kalidii]UGU15287.1 hypothetical protein LS482_16570 [Sinomicrobium kalidii]
MAETFRVSGGSIPDFHRKVIQFFCFIRTGRNILTDGMAISEIMISPVSGEKIRRYRGERYTVSGPVM